MTYKLGQLRSREEADEFNRKQMGYLGKGMGCIGSLACPNCFAIVSDSICCCGGITCPECGTQSPLVENIEPLWQFVDGKQLFKPKNHEYEQLLLPI